MLLTSAAWRRKTEKCSWLSPHSGAACASTASCAKRRRLTRRMTANGTCHIVSRCSAAGRELTHILAGVLDPGAMVARHVEPRAGRTLGALVPRLNRTPANTSATWLAKQRGGNIPEGLPQARLMHESTGNFDLVTLDGRRSPSGHDDERAGGARGARQEEETQAHEGPARGQRSRQRGRQGQETARAVCILSVLAKKEKKKKKSGMGAVGGFI
jgi:hypothetical protein